MTYNEVKTMIENIGLPFAYYQFERNPAPDPPYIIFWYPGSDDFPADNTNYQRIEELDIELYSARKDFDSEARIERSLNEAGIFYVRSESFIESEQLHRVLYETEVTINA